MDLLGYDEMRIEDEILEIIQKYDELKQNGEYLEARDLILNARCKYPQDFRIMHKYIFELVGGYADNSLDLLIQNEVEINKICNIILEGCKDERIRLDIITLKAKLQYAKGMKEEAINLLKTLPTFYHSSNQRLEQLYSKTSSNYFNQLSLNTFELSEFLGNKLARLIFYNNHF